VAVAHPDDETLWAGGTILCHRHCRWYVLAVCRAGDPDRAPRFRLAVNCLEAVGHIADLDDGPEQKPLPGQQLEQTILLGLPRTEFDVVLTHAPQGEYTRHRRHEEVSRAVIHLWRSRRIAAKSLMLFAYDDGNGAYLPRARPDAPVRRPLSEEIWNRKYRIITDIYGFASDSWEARTTPREEAFWRFDCVSCLNEWLTEQGVEQ
jgi:LmbE family N-acetylglucosaminyl deacetylase